MDDHDDATNGVPVGPAVKVRRGARVILLNERDEICLFLHASREERYWILPGGGLDPGESWEAAAIRELWEETGLTDVALGPCVWTREKDGMLFGEWTRAVERYFLVRVAGPDVEISAANQLDYERAVYHEMRWWSVAALRASDDLVFPEGLADLLAPLVAGQLPETPVSLRR